MKPSSLFIVIALFVVLLGLSFIPGFEKYKLQDCKTNCGVLYADCMSVATIADGQNSNCFDVRNNCMADCNISYLT